MLNNEPFMKQQIHFPQEEYNPKFPSMQKFCEIWSTCTNPDGPLTHVVTSSEDSTVKINELRESKLETVKKLEGHELASTSVDWKKDILISISDDRQIRVYKMPEAEYQYSLWTKDTVTDWHTLTYASMVFTSETKASLGVVT